MKNNRNALTTIALLLLIFTITGCAPSFNLPDLSSESDFEFSNGEIIKYRGSGGDAEIPSSIGGVPVTSIRGRAFQHCDNLTSITFPDSVTYIGNWAFSGCDNITRVIFPENSQLKAIGDHAFSYCRKLENITIPESVTSMGYCALYYCTNLTKVTFPENSQLNRIGDHGFAFCTKMESIEIPGSVTLIETATFRGCTSLSGVTINNGVTMIEEFAFWKCYKLVSIIIPDSVTTIKGYAFYQSKLQEIIIGAGVTIGDKMIAENNYFRDCYDHFGKKAGIYISVAGGYWDKK